MCGFVGDITYLFWFVVFFFFQDHCWELDQKNGLLHRVARLIAQLTNSAIKYLREPTVSHL